MISKPPGVEDIYPDRIPLWDKIVNTARTVFNLYHYKELITPVMEFTELFARGLGDESDIVSKEMFTFGDRGGRSLTLRPEGTASVVRAYIENGEYNRLSSAKFFYFGPMFRAERPQKGRLRQFNQFGAELFGSGDPYYDYEIMAMCSDIAEKTGIGEYTLKLNSIGCPDCRKAYIEDLKSYYISKIDELCEDCRRRLEKNTLRLLDCKKTSCADLKRGAPLIGNYLCDGCRLHHDAVKRYCTSGGISFEEDQYLVRGLDYYTRTTFEFVSAGLGGQNAFAAGGRYDNLVEQFGGKATPAVGFAAGIERMMLLLAGTPDDGAGLDYYIVHAGGESLSKAVRLVSQIRAKGFSVEIEPDAGGFKAQMKKANREKAARTIIIGEDETALDNVTIKEMSGGGQETVGLEQFLRSLRDDRIK